VIRFEHPTPGEELEWLAVDVEGRVAVFSSRGYGPVPLSVAAHAPSVRRAVSRLDPLRDGLFAYEWGPAASEPYVRRADPAQPARIDMIHDHEVAAAALLARLPLEFERSARVAAAELGVPLFGASSRRAEAPIPERYFERREIKEAIAFAEAGGIAVHRNFDSYHGSTFRGFRREKPFLHVIGLRPNLARWGRLQGLRPEWIQPEKRRRVAHYDVYGPAAEALIARLKPALDGK
jgi:hypothetical protein